MIYVHLDEFMSIAVGQREAGDTRVDIPRG